MMAEFIKMINTSLIVAAGVYIISLILVHLPTKKDSIANLFEKLVRSYRTMLAEWVLIIFCLFCLFLTENYTMFQVLGVGFLAINGIIQITVIMYERR